MSQNNTNRDIRRFETDADGNTTRVLLNTDEPLGLLDGDYQEKLEELENRLNAITGGAYSNTVQIGHGGTGAESAGEAMSNLVTALDVISSLNQNTLSFVAQQTGGSTSTIGHVYRVRQDAVAEQIGALKASNNLSDLQNALTGLQNLYHDVPIANPGVEPLKLWLDRAYVMLGQVVGPGGGNYYIEPNRYTLQNLVNNYLPNYFLEKSNNLSDLSDTSNAISNLCTRANLTPDGTVADEAVIPIANIPTGPYPSGKVYLSSVWTWIKGKIASVLGLEENNGQRTFNGKAATADVATTARGLSMSGGFVNMALKSVTKKISSGQNTYVFSSSDSDSETFSANDTIIGIRGLVTGGNGSVSIKNDYTIENTATVKTVTVDANVSTDGVAEVYLFCYYFHGLND